MTVQQDVDATIHRSNLITDFEAMSLDFHSFLTRLPGNALSRPSVATRWTNGALLAHVVSNLGLIPREIDCARSGKGLFNYPSWFSQPVNYLMMKRSARAATVESIGQRFDVAFGAAMAALAQVKDNEWSIGANFWGEGFRDIAGLLSIQPLHFKEHSDQVAGSIAG